MIIDDNGIQYDSYTNDTQLAICSMEYIYFARPDSNIHGVNVHTARKRMGAQLAREFKHEAISWSVCPILPSAQPWDLQEESGLPNEMGLIKNQYTTHLYPTDSRIAGARGADETVCCFGRCQKGKRVVMIDDSIVRGTTLAVSFSF